MELSAQVSSHEYMEAGEERKSRTNDVLMTLVVAVLATASVAMAFGAMTSSPEALLQIMELGMV